MNFYRPRGNYEALTTRPLRYLPVGTDFGDSIGITSRALIEGLFGVLFACAAQAGQRRLVRLPDGAGH